jgi:ribonuclease VapC
VVAGPSTGAVLDASALLAYLQAESGGQAVREWMMGSSTGPFISAINWSEVVQKSTARGRSAQERRGELTDMGLTILTFAVEDAEAAAALWPLARHLSLADRACLALAARLDVPALTTDRAWIGIDLGVEVQLIR